MQRWRHKVHCGNLASLGYAQSQYTGMVGTGSGGLWSDPGGQIDEEVARWEDFLLLDISQGGVSDGVKEFLRNQYLDTRPTKAKVDHADRNRHAYQRIVFEEIAFQHWTAYELRLKSTRSTSTVAIGDPTEES